MRLPFRQAGKMMENTKTLHQTDLFEPPSAATTPPWAEKSTGSESAQSPQKPAAESTRKMLRRAGALGRGRTGTPYFSETPLPRDPAWWERRGRYLDKWYAKGPGCWEWTGTKNQHGYGTATFLANGRVTTRGAHKLQYERHHGPIPAGLVVMHTCDNPGCVRLDHLELGTHADNNADCRRKGRANHSGLNRSGRIPKKVHPGIPV